MGKPKTDNRDEANGDIEENSTPSAKEPTKKGKKGRKNKDADWEDDIAQELENMALEEVGEKRETSEPPEAVPEKKDKKKEKKSKKSKPKDSDDDDEEEVPVKSKKGGGFALLMADDDDDGDDADDEDQPVIEEKKKNKKDDKPPRKEEKAAKKDEKPKKKKADSDDDDGEVIVSTKRGGGFAALMADDDDDDFDDDMEDDFVEEKKEVKKKNKKEEKPKPVVEEKKKGKKGKQKKKEEEDIDKILAELQIGNKGEKPKEAAAEESQPMAEEASKKKKKKKKENEQSSVDKTEETSDMKEPVENTPAEVKPTEAPVEVIKTEENHAKEEIKEKVEADKPKPEGKEEPKDKKEVAEEPKDKKDVPEVPKDQEGVKEEAKDDKPDGGEAVAEPSKSKKKKKKAKDAAAAASDGSKEGTPAPEEQDEGTAAGDEEGTSKKKKKKKDKEPKKEEEDKARKGKPSNKALAAMREILAKQKEEEERLRREEEERRKQEDERLRKLEEEKRIEQEKKEKRKQKEKERKDRLRAEGKLLTPKQKADQRRAQEMLQHRIAMGMVVPEVGGEKKPRPGTRIKPKKAKKDEVATQEGENKEDEEKKSDQSAAGETVEGKSDQLEEAPAVEEEKVEEVKDAWDETSDEEEEDTSEMANKNSDDDDDDDDESDSEEEAVSEAHKGEAVKRRQKVIERMAKRKQENLKKLDPENLRAPVVCVLGHVDHGKTKILDKLRKSNVQEGEVGGITQQIGATNVPAYALKKQTHMVKDFDMDDIKFPGLLIIDTPGHESFRNLRSRGSSLCDIAILVVDITQGLEPQTRESVNLLRTRGTPFLVALNKVDRVYEWVSHPSKDIREILGVQEEHSQNDFERRTAQVIQGLREEKLNSALFWENPNPKEYLSLVPTSAISGDGMGNLMSLICQLCQGRLKKNLMFSEELQCTVLEVKTIQGHGTTIDVILVNGRLREGDTIILAGTEGPIVTQIRSLLLPKPLKEIRVKGQYDEVKEISTAQGVKIAARDLEKAIPGLSLKVAHQEDEIEIFKELVDKEFHSAMRSMKVSDRGVYVQASTLGALEALLEFFKTNNVPYSGIRVGPVVKRDVMRAAAMLEHDPMYAVILAFDVKVEKDAQELADKEGVKIFSEETIYHLGDRYVEYLKDYRKKKQDEFRHIAVFPSKLKIIPTAVFNKRDPIVLGVNIEAGILRTGTPLCVPSKEFVEIGIVTSMEFDHKNVDIAKKGDEVCIKIENIPGHTPKLVGRHFEIEDLLVSKISRESINACKDYFRDDLTKNEWKLMIELKKQFQIL